MTTTASMATASAVGSKSTTTELPGRIARSLKPSYRLGATCKCEQMIAAAAFYFNADSPQEKEWALKCLREIIQGISLQDIQLCEDDAAKGLCYLIHIKMGKLNLPPEQRRGLSLHPDVVVALGRGQLAADGRAFRDIAIRMQAPNQKPTVTSREFLKILHWANQEVNFFLFGTGTRPEGVVANLISPIGKE